MKSSKPFHAIGVVSQVQAGEPNAELPRSGAWKRRLGLAGLVVLLPLLLLIVIILRFTSSSGEVWLQTKRELESRGEILDWEKLVPQRVPSAQNLYGDPVAASLLPVKGTPASANPLGAGVPRLPAGYSDLDQPFDLEKLRLLPVQADDRSLAVLAKWFSQWDESFSRLREAAGRPYVQLPGNYAAPLEAPIPDFVVLRSLAQVIVSRARVHWLLGRSNEVFQDLETLRAVCRGLDSRPANFVSAMVQTSLQGLYLDAVEESLNASLWSDAELATLGKKLTEMEPLRTVQTSLREGERAGVCRILSALVNGRSDPLYESSARAFSPSRPARTVSFDDLFVRASPALWLRRNQTQYALIMQEFIEAIDPEGERLDLPRIREASQAAKELTARWSPNTALIGMVLPNLERGLVNTARIQTRARQAGIACALERFRLARSSYPETLDQLAPEYLRTIPHDLFTGRSMIYRKTGEGYVLYAHGPNRKDDGGENGTTNSLEQLDWIWTGEAAGLEIGSRN